MKKYLFPFLIVVLVIAAITAFYYSDCGCDEGQKTLQMPFVQDDDGDYWASTFAGSVSLSSDGVTYWLQNGEEAESVVVNEKFVEANNVEPEGVDKSDVSVNFFIGDDESKWKSDVDSFNAVLYENLWEGIDLKVLVREDTVEKVFVVGEGVSVEGIRFEFEDLNGISINESGDLVMETAEGPVEISAPIAYQKIGGEKVDVEVSYEVDGMTYGFVVGEYDEEHELIIDPLLYSTYIGGGSSDYVGGITDDGAGYFYVVGDTNSNDIGTTAGVFDQIHNNNSDVYVARLNSDFTLNALTYIGGSDYDRSTSSATVGTDAHIYFAGHTASSNFPTAGTPYDSSHNGSYDGFVAKMSLDLTTLTASTFIGGDNLDYVYSMTTDDSDNVYFAGLTRDGTVDFPTTGGAYSTTYNGGFEDAYVAIMNSSLSSLTASTFIGGDGQDKVHAVSPDENGDIYVVGMTYDSATDFPTTGGAYDTTHNGDYDIFVSRFSGDLTALEASTLIGGSAGDTGRSLDLGLCGDVYMTGYTSSSDFPMEGTGYDQTYSSSDIVVAKFDADLTTLEASTFLGDSGSDFGYASAISADDDGLYIAGTGSSGYPVTSGAYDEVISNSRDAVISLLSYDLSSLEKSTFIGGNGLETIYELYLDEDNNVYAAGDTTSTDFPVTSGVHQETYDGNYDVFLTLIDCNLSGGVACTSETDAPVVSTLTPLDDGTAFGVSDNLSIEFDEMVVADAGNIVIYKASDDSVVETIPIDDARVTGNCSDTITINPTATLAVETDYYVQVASAALLDSLDNAYGGISDMVSWNFTTTDVTDPTIVSLSPAGDSTGVAIDSNLTMTFDEAVDVETGNLFIYRSDDQLLETIDVANASITGSGTTTIVIDPVETFGYGTGYYVLVDATAFDDLEGNSYAGISDISVWDFSTVANSNVASSGGSPLIGIGSGSGSGSGSSGGSSSSSSDTSEKAVDGEVMEDVDEGIPEIEEAMEVVVEEDLDLSRANTAKLIALMYSDGEEISEDICRDGIFLDVICGDDWFAKYVTYLFDAGVVHGYVKSEVYRPESDVRRAELLKLLVYARGLEGTDVSDLENPFSDVEEGDWYYEIVLIAYSMDMIEKGDGVFGGMEYIDADEFWKLYSSI